MEEEDEQRPSRERKLVKERIAHTNRIKALLHGQAFAMRRRLAAAF